MSLQSVKTRFMGSYLFLLVLFIVQIPIIFLLVSNMSEKYSQVDAAGGLRKRAAEITEILNRHILYGDESLEGIFQAKKAEYEGLIGTLRNGSESVSAITDAEILSRLDVVEKKWAQMRADLDSAMDSGDVLRVNKAGVEDSTFPMVAKLNGVIDAITATGDRGLAKHINETGFQRMRTVKLSYLAGRYFTAFDDKAEVTGEIDSTIAGFESSLMKIKGVAAAYAPANGAKGERLVGAVNEVENLWARRKVDVQNLVKGNDHYREQIDSLINVRTPEIVASANELTKLIATEAKSSAMKGVMVMAISVFVSAVIAALFMWMTNSLVLRPLLKVKETVTEFARGNLTSRANIRIRFFGKELDDEISGLGASVDAMADQMGTVIGRITDSSGHLASASEQLSASSTQIEEGANRQSSQTAQAATAMEEMSATVIEVAKNSQQVSESARNAQEIAVNGGEVVKEAIGAMQEVSESTNITAETIKKLGKGSEEIGTIVSVINDIADQTNLLALNAAIEAARAGEQGRGFAVVADEVRKLAERTTNATKEISDMIGSIQVETTKAVEAMDSGTQKVENGVRLAHEAGEALGKIVMGVQNVTDMISHIATSTEEQSATTDEITRNMDSIAEVSRSNVTAIGEVSNATSEMARLASELKELVSNFRIDQAASTAGANIRTFPGTREPSRQLYVAGKETAEDTRHNHVENL